MTADLLPVLKANGMKRSERLSERLKDVRGRLTARDRALVEAVWKMGYVTCDQLQDRFFTAGAHSNCQRRLRLLVAAKLIERLPGRPASRPAVYFVGSNARAGLRLLRAEFGRLDLRRRRRGRLQIEHLLAVNDLHCRLIRGCREQGYLLVDWRDQAQLAALGRSAGFVPDGFCLIRAPVGDRVAVAPFFLEVERSPRARKAMLAKYQRVAAYVASGAFAAAFGRRSLRLLVLTASVSPAAEGGWARRLAQVAATAGLDFGYFSSLREFMAAGPASLFTADLWWRADPTPGRQALGAIGASLRSPEGGS